MASWDAPIIVVCGTQVFDILCFIRFLSTTSRIKCTSSSCASPLPLQFLQMLSTLNSYVFACGLLSSLIDRSGSLPKLKAVAWQLKENLTGGIYCVCGSQDIHNAGAQAFLFELLDTRFVKSSFGTISFPALNIKMLHMQQLCHGKIKDP